MQAVDEGADEIALVVEEMHALRRGEDEIDMAGVKRIGREELAHEDGGVEDQQQGAGDHREAMAAETPPHHPPLRGHVEALLLRRHLLDGHRIERRRRDEMGNGLAFRARCPDRAGLISHGPPVAASAKTGVPGGTALLILWRRR